MITKERLEELIEQGSTIYRAYANVSVEECKLNKDYFKTDNAYLWKKLKNGAFKSCGYPLDQLFETKEDAEEYAEFGNITRTEKLKLPSWEDFKKTQIFLFESKEKILMELAIWESADNRVIKVTTTNDWNVCFFNKSLTRENYNEARRICVKLFKGEGV